MTILETNLISVSFQLSEECTQGNQAELENTFTVDIFHSFRARSHSEGHRRQTRQTNIMKQEFT